jgi:hypothetical protein
MNDYDWEISFRGMAAQKPNLSWQPQADFLGEMRKITEKAMPTPLNTLA